MKGLVVCLFVVLSIIYSCNSNKTYMVREGVKGYVYDKDTKKPIDSILVGFNIDYLKNNKSNLEKVYYSNIEGYFEIPKVEIKTHFKTAQRRQFESSKYINIKKDGYRNITLFIGYYHDTIYKRNKEKHIVDLDTIFLKQMK